MSVGNLDNTENKVELHKNDITFSNSIIYPSKLSTQNNFVFSEIPKKFSNGAVLHEISLSRGSDLFK